jgi:serine/threonine-protein phosphatase 4 regulatory subunit 1
VLWTLGHESWPQLRKIYIKLVKVSDPRLKRTLSHSIHEIAKIIGEEDAEQDLLPVIKLYLKDNIKDVRSGSMKALPVFLEHISVQSRLPFIDNLATEEIQKDWRMKVIVAKNIGKLAMLFPSHLVKNKLTQLFYKFSHDRNHAIRKAASKNLVYFLEKFSDDPEYQEQMIKTVKLNFFRDAAYWRRLSFLMMAGGVMKNRELFETHFMDEFLQLGNDSVINVKIKLA